MTQNDNEISDLFFQTVSEPEPIKDSAETISPAENNTTETPVENHYETMKIKKKRSISAPVAAIFILLAVTVTAVWYVISHGKNSDTASVNTESLEALFDFSDPIGEAMGINEISELLTNQSAKLDASITVSSLSDNPDASGMGVRYLILRDMDKKKASADVALSYRKAAILSATLYADENDICLKIPTLSSGVFTIGSSDIGAQIKKSPLFTESIDSEDEESVEELNPYFDMLDSFDIDYLFNQMSDIETDTNLFSIVINKLASVYPKDYKKITDGISYENIAADDNGNKGTKITVSEESIELLVKDLLTLALDDKDCQEFLKSYFQTFYSSFTIRRIDDMSFDDFIDTIFSRLRFTLASAGTAFAEYFNQDICFTIYKNSKGQLVNLTSENSIEIDGESLNVNLYITSGSTENPGDSMHFRLDCSDGDETVSLELVNSCNRNSEIIKHNQSLIFSFDDESIILNHNRTYNTATKKYEGIIKISEDSVELKLNATLNKAEKGKDYSFTLDHMDIVSENEILFSAVGEINVSKLNEEITKPSGTEYKILEMPMEELSPIAESISDSIDSLEKSLSSYGFDE